MFTRSPPPTFSKRIVSGPSVPTTSSADLPGTTGSGTSPAAGPAPIAFSETVAGEMSPGP